MPCTTTCVQPSPRNAHCAVCHITLSGVSAFDRHRRAGGCVDPAALGFVKDRRGIWRYPAPDPTARIIWPQRAESGSGVPESTPEDADGPEGLTAAEAAEILRGRS